VILNDTVPEGYLLPNFNETTVTTGAERTLHADLIVRPLPKFSRGAMLMFKYLARSQPVEDALTLLSFLPYQEPTTSRRPDM
jgi:hypothetical protein